MPKTIMFRSLSSLASALLIPCLGAGALNGCVLSQEDRVLNIPPLRNRPPRIMEEFTVTPDRVKMIIPSECPSIDFSFFAEDPDINDTLTVRWYVDYPASSAIVSELRLTPNPNGNTVRDQAKLTIDLSNRTLPVPASNLQQQGTHVVEALLFDFALSPQRKPYPITPATDGGIENPSYVVSYAWVVEASHNCPLP
jgi:hypothetical protein